jgi:hypothetical protein
MFLIMITLLTRLLDFECSFGICLERLVRLLIEKIEMPEISKMDLLEFENPSYPEVESHKNQGRKIKKPANRILRRPVLSRKIGFLYF